MSTTKYILVEGIPCPPPKRPITLFPFSVMKVGHSFTASTMEYEKLYAAAKRYNLANPGVKLAVRKIDNTTCGCWRTA